MNIFLITLAIILFLAMRLKPVPAIGVPLLVYFVIKHIPLSIFIQRAFAGVDQYTLVAIPLFVLVGCTLQAGQIVDDLVVVLTRTTSKFKSGIALSNIFATTLFSGVSGSAAADVASLGPISIPLMKKSGYPASYAAALTAASSVIGPMVPPSIVFIFYSTVANVPITSLFLAGFLPALMLVIIFSIVVLIQANRFEPSLRTEIQIPTLGNYVGAFIVLIIGGFIVAAILFGIATPTEAGAIAATMAIVLSFLRNSRSFTSTIINQTLIAARLSAEVLLLIAASNIFAWVLALEGVSQILTMGVENWHLAPIAFLGLLGIILLAAGVVLDTFPAILLIIPTLIPVSTAIGVNPLQMGVVVVLSLMVGAIHPPVGICLYVAARIAEVSIWSAFIDVLPFIAAILIIIALVCIFPEASTFLPSVLQ